jgi:hypothetical protein
MDTNIRFEAPPSPQPEAPPKPVSTSRFGRTRTFPNGYSDFLPCQPVPPSLSHFPSIQKPIRDSTGQLASPEPEAAQVELTPVQTEPNDAGLFRIYPKMPTSDPDDLLDLKAVCDSPNFGIDTPTTPPANPLAGFGIQNDTVPTTNFFAPFLNATVFRLINWFYGSATKSVADLDKLVEDVILQPDFKREHLEGFRASREIRRLDENNGKKDATFSATDGWRESSVKLRLPPPGRVKSGSEKKAPEFVVPGVFHRDLIDVIQSSFEGDMFLSFNTTPYKEFHLHSPNEPPHRVFGEAYSADAYYEAWEEIQALPREPDDKLERVVAGLMMWSDSTHLASFGNASMWPIYLYFGNQSKYTRAKPTAFASHHLAYIPSVSIYSYQVVSALLITGLATR